jgi:hypothetical protein
VPLKKSMGAINRLFLKRSLEMHDLDDLKSEVLEVLDEVKEKLLLTMRISMEGERLNAFREKVSNLFDVQEASGKINRLFARFQSVND